MPSPTIGVSELSGVAVTSASNAWAVGSDYGSVGFPGTLAEHWNGKVWAQVAAPDGPKRGFSSALNGVAASPAGNVWAVGSTYSATTLAARWTGSTFKQVASPAAGSLDGVAATSAANAWAAGDDLTLRWNGKAWTQVPNPAGADDALLGVAAPGQTSAWAVGTDCVSGGCDSGTDVALILHWNGKVWKTQASPGA